MAKNDQSNLEPNWTVTPGEYMTEIMQEKGMTVQDLGVKLGMGIFEAWDLTRASIKIDKDIAKVLAKELGETTKYWLGLEKSYRDDCERLARESIAEVVSVKSEDGHTRVDMTYTVHRGVRAPGVGDTYKMIPCLPGVAKEK